MRIANKSSRAASPLMHSLLWAALVSAPLMATTMAHADNALPVPPAPVAAAAVAPGMPMPPPVLTPAAPAVAGSGNDMNKNIAALEDKATDGAKTTLKNLDGTDPLTLDDLNRARQTAARIDAMIDIEKRLSELEKLRDAKNGVSSSGFAGAIPASALTPMGSKYASKMPSMPSMPAAQDFPPVVMHVTPSKPEISRITGADGKYEALLKMSDGDLRIVRVGDAVNGGTVRWITASAIGLDEKGQTSVIHVKNVDIVSSAIR